MNIKQVTLIPKAAIAAAAISTGVYYTTALEPKEKMDMMTDNNTTIPFNTPATAGTLFTLGLFGRKKSNEENEENAIENQEAKAATKAGMSPEKYRSLFEPTSKCNFMTIYGEANARGNYFNIARKWLLEFDANSNLNIKSVKKGFKIMNSCFEQYEKENIKIFEDEDKARCKQLMTEVSESIDKGEQVDYDKLSEIITIYDRKRLYPYI